MTVSRHTAQAYRKASYKTKPGSNQVVWLMQISMTPGMYHDSGPFPVVFSDEMRLKPRFGCYFLSAYRAAVLFVHVFPAYKRTSDCTPFGSGLSATLAWFPLTTFNSDLLTFTILHKPSSPAGRCFQLFASASRFWLDPFGRATFSRHAASRPLPAALVTIGYC